MELASDKSPIASKRRNGSVGEAFSGLSNDFLNECSKVADDNLDWPVLDGLDLIEGYAKRGLCLRVGMARKGAAVEVWATFKSLPTGSRIVNGAWVVDEALLPPGFYKDKHSVLVHNVKTIENPEFVAPSLVWLERAHECDRVSAETKLFLSLCTHSLKLVNAISDDEGGLVPFRGARDRASDMVESRSQVMNSVGGEEYNVLSHPIDAAHFWDFALRCAIWFLGDRVLVRSPMKERRKDTVVNVLDVMVGPFGFQ